MKEDYKEGVLESLDILRRQRKRLCEAVEADGLKIGLYENSRQIRKIYFQSFIVEWLDEHWAEVDKRIKSNAGYSYSTKQEIYSLFAKNFDVILSHLLNKKNIKESVMQEPNIRKMLNDWREKLRELKYINANCDENIKHLLTLQKEHKARFEYMLKQESEDTYE